MSKIFIRCYYLKFGYLIILLVTLQHIIGGNGKKQFETDTTLFKVYFVFLNSFNNNIFWLLLL